MSCKGHWRDRYRKASPEEVHALIVERNKNTKRSDKIRQAKLQALGFTGRDPRPHRGEKQKYQAIRQDPPGEITGAGVRGRTQRGDFVLMRAVYLPPYHSMASSNHTGYGPASLMFSIPSGSGFHKCCQITTASDVCLQRGLSPIVGWHRAEAEYCWGSTP